MAKQLQKLELTWIGKGKEPKLEPRILIEDPDKSYWAGKEKGAAPPWKTSTQNQGNQENQINHGSDNCNMLIQGDNLLALKALEQDFTNKIKCIYIDPPYNTGNAFEHYDDGVEHSLWLSLMSQRLKILETLLSKDGAIAIHLDDQEVHYAKVICDDIFGRSNFLNSIIVRDSHPSGLKLSSKDKTIIKTKSQILVYKKSKELRLNAIYQRRFEWDTHYNTFMDSDLEKKSLKNVLIEKGIISNDFKIDADALKNKKFREFCFKNRDKIFQSTKELPEEAREESSKNRNEVFVYQDANGIENYALNGRRLFPLSKSIQDVGIDGSVEEDFAKLLCDFWDDIDFNNTQNEGGVNFPASKKPEYLVGRILTLLTKKGDLVLDSFLGSGTTAAVAHKMGRRWIGIELGEHANTHCLPRLQKVVGGEDKGGISEAVNWKGGGGFKFYNLAPSLILKDKYGSEVINPSYNPNMLAAAMSKQEGFQYSPDESNYWKQGKSSEKDFIFTTTQFVTVEMLNRLHDEMKPDESLLVCCKSFKKECVNTFPNITIKKIPQMVLGRCEFGKDDYSLNIINFPSEENGEVEIAPETETTNVKSKPKKKKVNYENQPKLF